MKNWQRRLLGILALGGGASGISSTVNAVVQGQVLAISAFIPIVFALAFFVWGVWCGVLMLEGTKKALYPNAVFWLAQTPLLQTPVLAYPAFCGAQLQVFVKLSPFEAGISSSLLGAQFGMGIGQPGARITVGVNLFALCVSLWLIQKCKRAEQNLILDATTSA